MSIVKKLTIIPLFFTLIACSSFEKPNDLASNCHKKRAAFDIGSGTTKMVVADIDTCKNLVFSVIFEARRPIAFKEHINKNNLNFTQGFIGEAIIKINELKHKAKALGVTEFKAVATSAFRLAKNSSEVIKRINKETGLNVDIINQTREALIAFNATKSLLSKSNLLVWDIGGSSMQIVKSDNKSKNIYLGKLASVSFKDLVVEKIKNKKEKLNGPNPLNKKGAIKAMNLARDYATKNAKELIGLIDTQYVVGVGGVHYYSIKNQVASDELFYNQKDLLKTLLERAKLDDSEIGGDYAATEVTNLALVLGFMQALGIERVYPIKINMAHGILLD